MKKLVLILAIWLAIRSASSSAAERTSTLKLPNRQQNVGLGIIIGAPTGFTGKVRLSNKNAFDFGVAWYYGDFVVFYADYLWQWPGAFSLKSGEKFFRDLVPYVGVGALVAVATTSPGITRAYWGTRTGSVGAGVRIPLGIEWKPGDPPLGVFIEVAPGIGFVPFTYAFFQGGIGARWYF